MLSCLPSLPECEGDYSINRQKKLCNISLLGQFKLEIKTSKQTNTNKQKDQNKLPRYLRSRNKKKIMFSLHNYVKENPGVSKIIFCPSTGTLYLTSGVIHRLS